MPVVQLTLEQLIEAIRQLTPEEMARLDLELSECRRDRLRALTQSVRQRTQKIPEAGIEQAVEDAIRAARTSPPH
jgi:hypothetical protein